MRVALIPARGGSKRIPGKNIRPFHGRPIIAYSIDAALNCSAIDRVIVSTDDEEIASVARDLGAEVPFMRAPHLADDYATTLEVIADGLAQLEKRGSPVTALCCLYATAPFVTGADLAASYELFCESDASYVFAGTVFPYPIQRALRKAGDRMAMFFPEYGTTRSQDLEDAYHDAGQFYWCRPAAVKAGSSLLGEESALYLMDRMRVQDIDTMEDWQFAEQLFRVRHEISR